MSELDRLREEIAYLKYAQGVLALAEVSLVGWLFSASDEPTYLNILAVVGILVLSFGILVMHRKIARCIGQIGRL